MHIPTKVISTKFGEKKKISNRWEFLRKSLSIEINVRTFLEKGKISLTQTRNKSNRTLTPFLTIVSFPSPTKPWNVKNLVNIDLQPYLTALAHMSALEFEVIRKASFNVNNIP